MEGSRCEETQESVPVKVEHATELEFLPSHREARFSGVNFKEEADVQYSLVKCVKEDTEYVIKLSYSDIGVCEENETLADPYTDKLKNEPVFTSDRAKCDVSELTSPYTIMLKDELVSESELNTGRAECDVSELASPYTNMLKDEFVLLEHVKKCDMSEAATANLYTDHAVKDEIVLGPEHPHRPDVTLAVRSWALADADSWSAMPASVRVRLKQLKDCFVKLERLPSDAAMLLGNQAKDTTTHDTKLNTEQKYTSCQSICGLCGEAFTIKADLKKHVMKHIHMPTSMMEEEKRLLSDYEKLRSSIRDCWIKLERCDSTDHKPAETIVPISEKETGMRKIHTVETNYYICDICTKTFQEKHSLVYGW